MAQDDLLACLVEYQAQIGSSTSLSDYTKLSYHNDLSQFQGFLSNQVPVSDDNYVPLLNAYFQQLISQRNLKPSTIKRKYTVIRGFFVHMEKQQRLRENPFRTFFYKPPRERILPKVLQRHDLEKILSSVKRIVENAGVYHSRIAVRDLAIIDLLICTGIRIGELSRLNVQDYNQSTNTMIIKGKGNKERILYISSPNVVQEIAQWLSLRPVFNPHSDALFVNKYGNTFSIFGIENVFYKYRDLSGIDPEATPHYLRHTFASVDTFVV